MTAAEAQATTAELRPIDPRAYGLARWILRWVFDGWIHTTISGQENLPPAGTATLITANHVSSLDVFAAGYAVNRPAYFVAKAEATRIPLLGPLMLACGAFPAQRDGNDMDVLRLAVLALQGGNFMGIAPEGTRSPDGRMGPYDPGFVWLAAKTRAVVVPAAIHGAWQLMPKGANYPRRGPLWVRFGAPMDVAPEGGRLPRERMAEVAGEVRDATLALLRQLVAESGVPHPSLEDGP